MKIKKQYVIAFMVFAFGIFLFISFENAIQYFGALAMVLSLFFPKYVSDITETKQLLLKLQKDIIPLLQMENKKEK